MNLKHQHIIISICLLLCGLSGFVACTDESPEFPHKEEDGPISLTFQADVAGTSTRAGEEPVADDCVNTLRIVIVSKATEGGTGSNPAGAEWKVEHNKRFNDVGPQRPLEYTFQVAANSLKKVYLIANESGLVDAGGQPLDFTDGQFIPAEGTGRAPVDDYVFDVSKQAYNPSALPMTALYEIDVPPLEQIQNGGFAWPNPLYLVRAATKFSFKFTNQSTRAITVTGIDIDRVITDRMYLMPHVNKITSEGEHKGKYWVFDDTKTETEDPKSYITDWVEWMGQEAKNSETGNDHQWLTDYEVPDKATAGIATVPFTLEKIPAATDEQPSPSVEASNAIYLPESKTVKDSNDPLKLQEYSITVYTKEQAGGGTNEEKIYPAKILPHLASLFRNTHVMVGFIFTEDADELVVDVIPFTSVELKPDYGLDKEDFTGYVVGKDKNGNKCWYDGNYYDPETAVPLYLGPSSSPESFVTINNKEYLLVYADYERTAAKLDHFFEKDPRKKYLLDPTGRTGYSFTLDSEHPEWGPDIYYNKLQQRVWLNEDYNEWTVGEKWDANQQKNVEAWFWQAGTTWYRTLNEWDRLNWNQAIYWNWPRVYPKYWFDIFGNRYPWSEGDTKEKRRAKLVEKIGEDWVKYLE